MLMQVSRTCLGGCGCSDRHKLGGRETNSARASVCSKQSSQRAFCHGNGCYEDQDIFAVDGKKLKPDRLCGRSPLFESVSRAASTLIMLAMACGEAPQTVHLCTYEHVCPQIQIN